MTGRLLIVIAVAAAPGVARAEWLGVRGFDAPNLTWSATHIVLVENGKVVESWTGHLKAGAKLPDWAAGNASRQPPQFDPEWLKTTGEKPPPISGKRMLLFLSDGPSHRMSGDNTAWVEGDRVYVVEGPGGLTSGLWSTPGTLAGLKEQVNLGLDLRARFDAAKAEPDKAKRADRLAALVPAVRAYADGWGTHDAFNLVADCGAAGVPYLVRWATDPKGKFRHDAWWALCRTGDAGVDAVLKVLDEQATHWKVVAGGLKPGQKVELPESPQQAWRNTNGLYHLVSGVRTMRLSADNQKRVREHSGLAELDRLLEAHPGLKPGGTRMEEAHARLRDIRAGHFRPDD
jgi:hypothetical protein